MFSKKIKVYLNSRINAKNQAIVESNNKLQFYRNGLISDRENEILLTNFSQSYIGKLNFDIRKKIHDIIGDFNLILDSKFLSIEEDRKKNSKTNMNNDILEELLPILLKISINHLDLKYSKDRFIDLLDYIEKCNSPPNLRNKVNGGDKD